MGTAQAVLLGILQGATEFLPVSSSAHLVAAQQLMNAPLPGIVLEVVLHVGTLLAILLVLWRSIWRLLADGWRGAVLIVGGADRQEVRRRAPLLPTAAAVAVGTVPAAVGGVLLERQIEGFFESLPAAGIFLVGTGVILLTLRWAPQARAEQVGIGRGLLIGTAQALALLPGISRSGVTIAAGCWAGVRRDVAGRFSFLLAVPAVAGAALWQVISDWPNVAGASAQPLPLLFGMLAAAATGTLCLKLLLRLVDGGRLHWFAAYCIPAGLAMIALGLLRG